MLSTTWIQSCKSRWPAGLGQMHCISGFLYIPACGADQLLQLDHAIKEAENPVWDILAWKCNYKSRKSTGEFVIKNKKRILGRKTARNQPIHQRNHEPGGSTPRKAPQMGPDINKSEGGTSTLAFSLRAPLGWAPGRGRQLRAGVGPAWGMGASCTNYYWHAPAW